MRYDFLYAMEDFERINAFMLTLLKDWGEAVELEVGVD